MHTPALPCYLAILLASTAPPVLAQTFFDSPRTFSVSRSCEATSSIRSGSNPVPLKIGQAYTALGENRPTDSSHVFIEIDGKRRWVALDCGQYLEAAAPAPVVTDSEVTDSEVTDSEPNADCPPFFDDLDNPVSVHGKLVDITPPPPTLDAFDLAVTETCGAPGQRVSRRAFEALLRDHPAVLDALREFTGNRVFPARSAPVNADAYLEDLTDAWVDAHGFEHIFCGELESDGDIGGLHYQGRYWQLQQSGLACRLKTDRQPEIEPGVIYTVGASIEGPGRTYRHPIKGYGYTLSATDILQAATRAFLDNPTRSRSSTACILELQDDAEGFSAVFVRRAAGIRTFYPDASPSSRDPACRNALILP